ncbi:MAG TPA: hypothetical protein VFW37_07040 [Alphaproteobacteria bacterium]|nr:hypothetical protein [Alphaproteobacteria bacterium]
MSKTTNKFAPEVRERAIRMVLDRRAALLLAMTRYWRRRAPT